MEVESLLKVRAFRMKISNMNLSELKRMKISDMNLSEFISDCKMNQKKTFETFLTYFNKIWSLGMVPSKS